MAIAERDIPYIRHCATTSQRTAGENPHMNNQNAPFGIPSTPKENLDFEAIARAALPHAVAICERLLPGGKLRAREWVCGSLRGDPGTSCSVNTQTGKWADFASNAKGGDLTSLVAAIQGSPHDLYKIVRQG